MDNNDVLSLLQSARERTTAQAVGEMRRTGRIRPPRRTAQEETQTEQPVQSEQATPVSISQDEIESMLANLGYTAIREESEEEPIEEEPGEVTTIPPDEAPLSPQDILTDEVTVKEETLRFSTAAWFKTTTEQIVTIAGVGGIGSWASLLIAKLNPAKIILYDMDRVEPVNMAGQLYKTEDYYSMKVDAMTNTIGEFAKYTNVFAIPEPFTEQSETTDIMICGFDNMRARRTFFAAWRWRVLNTPEEERKKCLFIDGRLDAELLQVLCIRGDDAYNIERYEQEYLFSDEDAAQAICSYKQTSFMANIIGGMITNLLVNFCANLSNPLIPRPLPFYTEYSAEYMYLKQIF